MGTDKDRLAVGLKDDLAWTEREIRKAEVRGNSKRNLEHLEYLRGLKANIEAEINRPPTYETFRAWPKGQGKVRFWQGRP